MPTPADDCLVPGLDDPNTAVRCEPFPGPESPYSLPACVTVRAVLSARPSGAPDWVGFQDLYDTARGIFDLCNAHDPGGGRVITVWTAESFMQILGVWRSAVFRWKPGLCIAATSYSGLSEPLRTAGSADGAGPLIPAKSDKGDVPPGSFSLSYVEVDRVVADVWSRSGSSFGVPFTIGLCVLFRRD